MVKRMQDPFFQWCPIPTGDQRNFLRDAQRARRETLVLLGGNRSGKTETAAYAIATMARATLASVAAERKSRGQATVIWVIGQTMSMAGSICWRQKLSRMIPPEMIDVIAWHHRAKGHPEMVRLNNGVELHFRSGEQGRGSQQGEAIHAAWIDEQIHETVREEVEMRCIDHMAPVLMSQTPLEPDPIMQQRYETPPPGWKFYSITIDDNRKSLGGYLDDAEVERMLAQLKEENPALYETRRAGRFAAMSGLIYPGFSTGLHVISEAEADRHIRGVAGGCHLCMGVDFGVSVPTAVLFGVCDPSNDTWAIVDEVYQSHASIETIIGKISDAEARMGINRRSVRAAYCDTGDTTATGETKDDHKRSGRKAMREAGYPVVSASKSFWPGIYTVQKYMARVAINSPDGIEFAAPRLLISSRCVNLIREIRGYSLDDKGTDRRDPADAKARKKNDHAVDAMRYMIHTHAGAATAGKSRGYEGAKWSSNSWSKP